MRRVAIIGCLAMTGCLGDQQTASVRLAPVPMTKCEQVAALLSNPQATQGAIAAAMEIGRNNGCFGTPKY